LRATYLIDAAQSGQSREIEVLAVDANARIGEITSFHTSEAFTRFGLPIEVVLRP
jgi:hypothetical protein